MGGRERGFLGGEPAFGVTGPHLSRERRGVVLRSRRAGLAASAGGVKGARNSDAERVLFVPAELSCV